jgi:ankyrin repeat protein
LDDLPKSLDETYERTLEDIGDQNWEYAHRLFQCVAAASRPLRTAELAEFLAFDFEAESTPKYLEDWRLEDPGHAVFSICSSLLTVVNVDDSPVIQFTHFSVKEYLVSTRIAKAKDAISRFHVSMTSAHTMVAQACLGILLHLDESIAETGLEKYPLAEYAMAHWIGHSQFDQVSGNIQGGMERLFDPKNRHVSIFQFLWIYDQETCELRPNRLNFASQDSATPLHYAAAFGIHDVINFLVVERSQDVNARGFSSDKTPLDIACCNTHVKVARALLEHDPDTETRCPYGHSPLDHAACRGAVDLVRLLLDHGAGVNAQGEDKNTSLHYTSNFGRTDVVRVLVERGADVNARNIDNSAPLHEASGTGSLEISRLLLENGAEVDAQNSRNETPLHLASQGGYLDLAKLLLQCNADVHVLDNQGKTPLHLASQGGRLDIAKLLLQYNADVHALDNQGKTPFRKAYEG